LQSGQQSPLNVPSVAQPTVLNKWRWSRQASTSHSYKLPLHHKTTQPIMDVCINHLTAHTRKLSLFWSTFCHMQITLSPPHCTNVTTHHQCLVYLFHIHWGTVITKHSGGSGTAMVLPCVSLCPSNNLTNKATTDLDIGMLIHHDTI